ncbi:hypothetical protein DPMN_079558 [Dreissena polymorpha]|uniref:Uncharacterized protein n=1 Tax=Dreissena polymorpha TaxID=45954 RepID=A0A9D3YPR1_DREPO|nr:hypothetical protein DPMN_079558 [Dreissena polymorpha]
MIDGRTEDNNTNEIRQSTSKIWLRTDSRTDGQRQNNIPPPLARDYIHTKFQRNPPKRFQDMAPDTKMPINFQDMAPDTKVPDGRTDRQRQNNIPPPLAGDNKSTALPVQTAHLFFFLKEGGCGVLEQTDQQTNRQTGQKQYVPHYSGWGT